MIDKDGNVRAKDVDAFTKQLITMKPKDIMKIAKVLNIDVFEVTPDEEGKVTKASQLKFKEGSVLIGEILTAFAARSRGDRRFLIKTMKKMG